MKRKQVQDSDNSDSDEDYHEEPLKKQRHSTGSAFMNSFNSILGDPLLVHDYCNSENLPLGIKFKVILRSFKQMTIIEKFFIFNKLHSIDYSNISESDCIELLSLGFTPITDDEIENLQLYFKSKLKKKQLSDDDEKKYTLFDFENEDSRLFWQLSFQTWVTFYHDMVDTYTTRYSKNSKNPNEISQSFNDNVEQISKDTNFYVKAIQIIRKKLRHIPGKTSGKKELTKLYNNLTDVLSTMDETRMEKVDGIHMINEKVLSSNFYFHFLQTEEEKNQLLDGFLRNKSRIRNHHHVENVKVTYPLTTKTSFSSIPIPILNLERAIQFFNDFIKPRESFLIKSIRGTHIKMQYSNYGRRNSSDDEQDQQQQHIETLTSSTATTPTQQLPAAVPATQVAQPGQTPSKDSSVHVPSVEKTPVEAATKQQQPIVTQPPTTTTAASAAASSSKSKPSSSNSNATTTTPQQQAKTTTTTPQSSSSSSSIIEEQTVQSSPITKTSVLQTTPPTVVEPKEKSAPLSPIAEESDVEVFGNWWMGEYKNFDFSKHQAIISAKRLLQFFSVAMRQKDPTFHMDSSHTSWRLIRKAIERGEILGLKVEGEGGRSFKVVNQQ